MKRLKDGLIRFAITPYKLGIRSRHAIELMAVFTYLFEYYFTPLYLQAQINVKKIKMREYIKTSR